MVLRSLASTRSLIGSVAAVAVCTLAACGSSSAPSATTAAAVTTVAAATTVAETATTVKAAVVDANLGVIKAMTDCDTVAAIRKISQDELAGASDDYGKKLYGDRVGVATARATELKCPAA